MGWLRDGWDLWGSCGVDAGRVFCLVLALTVPLQPDRVQPAYSELIVGL